MNYILFDDDSNRENLLPFTFTRPIAQIRIGILTIKEKWNYYLGKHISYKTKDYLQVKFPLIVEEENTYINASILPNKALVTAINALHLNQALINNTTIIAYKTNTIETAIEDFEKIKFKFHYTSINNTWDIFSKNGSVIKTDFELLIKNKISRPIPNHCVAFNKENIFIEEGAILKNCTLNAENGPIYIAKESQIMEGATIRGPFALCNNAVIKMGAKIYGDTTIGPYSKVGGEVNNSVIFGYSNKGHDGFLGNSVIGEWCNLGADTNNSNLKNNYTQVRLWNYKTQNFAKTGLQFCGLMMGDHSKCGINTMFNTGTVVGVSANIFGAGFPRNFIPSFSWGGSSGYTTYLTKKAFEVSKIVMKRRDVEFTIEDENILLHIFDITKQWRKD